MNDMVAQGPALAGETRGSIIATLRQLAGVDPDHVQEHEWVRFNDVRCTRAEVHAALAAPDTDARCDLALVGAARLDDFRVLAMDMDSTLITIECIDELAALAGAGAEVAAVTAATMRGELDFSASLRRRVALLRGLPESALEQVWRERLRLSPGAETLIGAARRAGLGTLLVSGGFTWFAERLQRQLGLNEVHANRLEIANGRLTGAVLGSVLDGAQKAAALQAFAAKGGARPEQVIAIGDGANDLPMMALAGLSVAWRAKPRVRAAATCALDHAALDGVLRLFRPSPGN